MYNLGIKQPIDAIITAYQKHQADAIGLSGLLVKSTLVMKEDLQTLNERGLTPPVILGGAALTRKYVEEDLRAIYKGPLYYGEDAFEGLRIMDEIVARKKLTKVGSVMVRRVAETVQTSHRGALRSQSDTTDGEDPYYVYEQVEPEETGSRSQAIRPAPDIPEPPFLGTRMVTNFDLWQIFTYLNELTLFSTQWQFRKGGVSPAAYARMIEEVARPKLRELQTLCVEQGILQPAAVYGYFPAAGEGNRLIIYREDHTTPWVSFTFPRQKKDRLCLSDYVAPPVDGRSTDYVAFMAVTMGSEVSRVTQEWYRQGKYQDYLYLHGLSVEATEALAEYFHRYIRQEWGIAHQDACEVRKIFKKHYRGCRYSFGYPACPRLEDQAKLFELIDPTRIGITLSEQFQLHPEQSTTALILHHPQAKYFNV